MSILPKLTDATPKTSLLSVKRKASEVDTQLRTMTPTAPYTAQHSPYVEVKEDDTASQFGLNSTPKKVRPVTSCTFCRQHKIKCNASQNDHNVCLRCIRLGLKCEIDPQFRPKKGSQMHALIGDVEDLKAKIDVLTRNEHLLIQALNRHNMNFMQQQAIPASAPRPQQFCDLLMGAPFAAQGSLSSVTEGSTEPQRTPSFPPGSASRTSIATSEAGASLVTGLVVNSMDTVPCTHMSGIKLREDGLPEMVQSNIKEYSSFVLGDFQISLARANELHYVFMTKFNPFMPILSSNSATELYQNSQLLFWTVILTASLSEPDPTLYLSLASLIKQLAIETCWIRTPRSTHVIQALIILAVWPLPNEKVLDDCSYRFVGLAKNLLLQLGLHRGGEFIQEFSRSQANLGPDSGLWRTRSWLAVFFCDHFWSSALGLPPSIKTTDYLVENARSDSSLPPSFRCLISLSIFQCKLVNAMGISVTRSDGLLEPLNRAASLNILDRELERLKFKLNIPEGSPAEVYYLYLGLMICCFAFLPGTPIEDQVKYVSTAYLSATRIVTIVSQLLCVNTISLIELPIFIRQSVTYSAFILFKLHLTNYLMDKYVDSARQSIVTVHRLFRNTLSSWKNLKNDISRTARVLEDLNIVLYTYPVIFNVGNFANTNGSIISRMRSHLTASLFYDLLWCIHEARRRSQEAKNDGGSGTNSTVREEDRAGARPQPLPFYNQITKDDFNTIITTTPNGTTVTTLVPTDHALLQAQKARLNSNKKPLEINGIPLSMLEATGSTKDTRTAQGAPAIMKTQLDEYTTSNQSTFEIVAAAPDLEQLTPAIFENGQGGAMPIGAYESTPLEEGIASQLDSFFLQQSNGWLVNNNTDDDFLGWIDMNIILGNQT